MENKNLPAVIKDKTLAQLNKDKIIKILKKNKLIFEKEDIKLLGLFGSYSRDEADENSDIDILIETTPKFLEKYKGFSAFAKLDELKGILKDIFKKEIDFIDKQGLIQNNNRYILDKAIYV